MFSKVKRALISWFVTPDRARRAIASVVSWLLCRCMASGAWDAVSTFPKWLRKLADFIDAWNATELPADKDELILDLVKDAITDEDVDRLVDEVAAMANKDGGRDD